ncbi:MAG: radical SAM protein [Chloroflexi bacterium]|nr:radical SAM protein [Chloroflexota bacterium]MCY3697594.1 radical SAM protein [Chloroflexota bacterium]
MAANAQLNPFSDMRTHAGSEHRPETGGVAEISYADTSQVLTKATGFMDAYDFTLNPYSGCGFGCTYCYAAFFARDAEKRDNWGYWVNVKQNAVELLSRPRQQSKLDGALIYMSSVTDAYQPVERELGMTRGLLEIMAYGSVQDPNAVEPTQASMFAESTPTRYAASGHAPRLVVQTRSPDVTRDIDLFQQIKENGGKVQVNMTVTTDDETVRKTFEPSCPSNARRIDAIRQVHEADVQACVTLTPLIWANDAEVFAQRLLDTGIERFIIQPFKFTSGKFVAQTRQGALKLMADLLDCSPHPQAIEHSYMQRYQRDFSVIKDMLGDNLVGEAKEGFKPPF